MPHAEDPKHRRSVVGRVSAVLVALALMFATAFVSAPLASATTQDDAVAYAASLNGNPGWNQLCLKFVHDMYLAVGFDTAPLATDNSSAVGYWNSFAGFGDMYTDTNPPAGALVFWGATSSNPYGHVALAVGDGTAWSSTERTYSGVHLLTIANRNAQGYPYLGYITFPIPQPGT